MTTCRPDISFTSVKLSQSNSAPAEHHYHGLKHAIRYIYITCHDGIYFWRTSTRDELPAGPLPTVNSNIKDLLLDGRPQHDADIAVAYGDLDWATCVKSRCSFSGICIQLAGGTIAYKTKFQPTIALSSTEAEFMAACDVGWMCLFVRVSFGILISHKRRLRWFMRTMMVVLRWAMPRNLLHARITSTLSILRCVTGWSATSSSSNELTLPSTQQTTSQKSSLALSFINKLIFFWVMSPQNIRRYIDKPSQHTATITKT